MRRRTLVSWFPNRSVSRPRPCGSRWGRPSFGSSSTGPRRGNALSLEVMQALIGALDAIAADPAARVVVLEGSGPAFSAGHDLAEMVEDRRERVLPRAVLDLRRADGAPARDPAAGDRARCGGVATAAGCQLVAACDLAVASDAARFATPGVNIGLFCSTPMVPISRSIGRKRALEMLLTGDMIDAATALEWGLVNRVVPCLGARRGDRRVAPSASCARAPTSSRSASARSTRRKPRVKPTHTRSRAASWSRTRRPTTRTEGCARSSRSARLRGAAPDAPAT